MELNIICHLSATIPINFLFWQEQFPIRCCQSPLTGILPKLGKAWDNFISYLKVLLMTHLYPSPSLLFYNIMYEYEALPPSNITSFHCSDALRSHGVFIIIILTSSIQVVYPITPAKKTHSLRNLVIIALHR